MQEAPEMFCKESPIDLDGVYVFISLDLTNSTKFKSEQPKLWKPVISAFYDKVLTAYGVNQYQSLLKNLTDEISVEFWKFVGDEVLLYANVHDCRDILKLVKSTDEAVKKIIDWISEKVIGSYGCQKNCLESVNQVACSFYEANYLSCKIWDILKNTLGVKATVWLALCGSDEKSRNIIHKTASAMDDWFQSSNFDFLGPEIDEGFRIAKYSVKNRVVVSPILTSTLYLSDDESNDLQTIVENNFAIVSYQKLKGIWHDRFFPIVMYSTSSFKNIHDEWNYDEIELPTYSEIKVSGSENERCKASYLPKILKDVNLFDEVNKIVALLKNTNYKRTDKKRPNQLMEIHVACATFNKHGLLMVKKHNVRGWEFGCVHISPTTLNWKYAITEGYKLKYAMNIVVDENPIPIATYMYQKSNNKVALGLIVVGELSSDEPPAQFVPMSLQQINKINDITVDSFKENSQKAFSAYYDWRNKK